MSGNLKYISLQVGDHDYEINKKLINFTDGLDFSSSGSEQAVPDPHEVKSLIRKRIKDKSQLRIWICIKVKIWI